ncbi:hypothetical protein Plec18167_008369 [Paecilomyces lecythidis]|uniref:Uncharacterized protein n=1 Tax=Paecilomyces lecythidis TaxID=3004212 RepID=A0ABR3WX68_9EURO
MSPKAVNRPVDAKQKEKDINTKLQLYGIYSAFENGKLPTNKQCDVALNSALKSKALTSPSKELSSEGQRLVQDLRDVIDQSKKLWLSKNEGNLLQEFVWSATHLGSVQANKPNLPIDKESAQQDGNQALEGLKTLGELIITNGEFRKLLSDATVLLRDIAGDAASKAAGKVKPSEEQLAAIDEPAPENTWHEKPNLSKEQLKSQWKAKTQKNADGGRQTLEETADTATQAATGGQDPRQTGDVDVRAGAQATTSKLQEAVDQNVPEETKSRSREVADQTRERTKNYLNEKVPEERRDQFIARVKKMLVEIQGHSDYQQAIETLLTLAEKYGGHGKDLTSQAGGSVKDVRSDENLKSAETKLRLLIERFANYTSTDDFFDSLNAIYRDADQDPQLKGWFKHVDSFIRKCLREQGYVLKDEATNEWRELYDDGRFLLRERYRGHTDRVVDEIKFLADQFDQDPQNKAFANSMDRLFKDLGQDQNGKPAFKKHLVKDITNVILPAIFENVRYIPIPRIEVSDPMVDVIVENLVIESDNLMPNVVEFGSDNYWRWGRKKISNKNDNKTMISASGIQLDLRDVSYYVKKKQGFPSLTDMGVIDIFLGGEGFSFKLAASNAHKKDRQNLFKVDDVKVKVHNLDLKVKKSKHKALFTLVKPLLFKVVRPAIEKVLEKQIRDNFEKADAFANDIRLEVKRSRESAREDEDLPNVYSQYLEVFKKRMTEKKQKAEQQPKRDTKVQAAMTHHDSLFKDIKLPGGISNKATEYKELAQKGERWQSPVFDWGSASESSDIPRAQEIKRKPHGTAESRVRDRSEAGQTGQQTAAGGYAFTNGGTTDPYATNGRSTGYSNGQGTNGYSNGGYKATAPNGGVSGTNVDGYPTDGFSKHVNQAFSADTTRNISGSLKQGTDGLTVPGTSAPVDRI